MPFEHPITGEEYSIVNLFAGSGAISAALKKTYGCDPDVAVNHCPDAIQLHIANYPSCRHFRESIYKTDPQVAMKGLPRVWHCHLSPDCTSFSNASSGRPIQRGKRFLENIAFHWIDRLDRTTGKPILLTVENVPHFRRHGPLIQRRLHDDGAVVSSDLLFSEHEPSGEPLYFHVGRPEFDKEGRAVQIADPRYYGKYYRRFINRLRRRGYKVADTDVCGSDFGDATIRNRFALVAILKGHEVPWPAPTHGDPKSDAVVSGKLKPWRTAADVIDFGRPSLSAFATPEETKAWNQATGQNCRRPHVFNTEARIAMGLYRFVMNTDDPYVINAEDYIGTSGQAKAGGKIAGYIVRQNGGMDARDARLPVPTLLAAGSQVQAAAAHLTIHHGRSTGSDARMPLRTIETKNSHAVTAHYLVKLRGSCKDGQTVKKPLPTLTAGGNHVGNVTNKLVPLTGTAGYENRIEAVRRFLQKHFGPGSKHHGKLTDEQMLGIITVKGIKYQIADISMRMLLPVEAKRSHSLDDDFEIARRADGKVLPINKQMEKIGNGVAVEAFTAVFRAVNDYALNDPGLLERIAA